MSAMPVPARSSSTRPAASRSATGCSTRTQRSGAGQPRTGRNTLTSGHRACQGCGEALGARYALDAAMRATGGTADRGQRHRLPRGVLHALPRDAPGRSPWLHSLFANAAAVGIWGGCRAEGPGPRGRPRPGHKAATVRPSTSASPACPGMFERGDDVLYVCYDNEAYINTGVQRSEPLRPSPGPRRPKPSGPSPATRSGRARTCR